MNKSKNTTANRSAKKRTAPQPADDRPGWEIGWIAGCLSGIREGFRLLEDGGSNRPTRKDALGQTWEEQREWLGQILRDALDEQAARLKDVENELARRSAKAEVA